MQNNHSERWVKIVANLTLARSIMGTAITDIDDLVSEIDAGRLQGTGLSHCILEDAVKDLVSSSESIDDVAATIPEILLALNEPKTQPCCSACQAKNTDHILSQSTLFDLSQFTSLERIAS